MEFFVIIVWLFFAHCVGGYASSRGREGVGWGVLSLIISPILAFIVISILPDLQHKKEQEIQAQKEKENKLQEKKNIEKIQENEKKKLSSHELLLSLEKLKQLNDKKIYSDIEYAAHKLKIIDGLKDKIIQVPVEVFLGDLIPLMDAEVLTKDEMDRIKNVLNKSFDNVAYENTHPESNQTTNIESDSELMGKYGITYENNKYCFKGYKYDRLSDAVSYAKLQN